MLLEWFNIFYSEFKGIFTLQILVVIVAIGLFAFFIDYKSLEDKKLKREAKLCRAIGALYVVGATGLYFLLNVFD